MFPYDKHKTISNTHTQKNLTLTTETNVFQIYNLHFAQIIIILPVRLIS